MSEKHRKNLAGLLRMIHRKPGRMDHGIKDCYKLEFGGLGLRLNGELMRRFPHD